MAQKKSVEKMARDMVPLTAVDVSVYQIPTDLPESDGTIEWDSTTLVVVWVKGGGKRNRIYLWPFMY